MSNFDFISLIHVIGKTKKKIAVKQKLVVKYSRELVHNKKHLLRHASAFRTVFNRYSLIKLWFIIISEIFLFFFIIYIFEYAWLHM